MRLVSPISFVLLVGSLSACADKGDEGMFILNNTAPPVGRDVHAHRRSGAAVHAAGEISRHAAAAATGYVLTPLIESRITAVMGDEAERTIHLEGANVTLTRRERRSEPELHRAVLRQRRAERRHDERRVRAAPGELDHVRSASATAERRGRREHHAVRHARRRSDRRRAVPVSDHDRRRPATASRSASSDRLRARRRSGTSHRQPLQRVPGRRGRLLHDRRATGTVYCPAVARDRP